MPKITITEKDYTRAGVGEYTNFAVVVPGFRDALKRTDSAAAKIEAETGKVIPHGYDWDSDLGDIVSVFDDNGVYEVSSQAEFLKIIGAVEPERIESASTPAHYGNQMAYELLGLGFTVLYLDLGPYDSSSATINSAYDKLISGEIYEALKDKATYDFRFVVNGLLSGNSAANIAAGKFAADRGDCVALLDLDADVYGASAIRSSTSEIVKALINDANTVGGGLGTVERKEGVTESAAKYAALFAPAVYYNYKNNNYKNNKFPAVFHYLACFALAKSKNFAEWYAAAGLVRGLSTYQVLGTEVKLGEVAINRLEPRCYSSSDNPILKHSVNVIAKVRNMYYLWGNRTAHELGEKYTDAGDLVASHFLNIRQLCSTLKKQIYITCRRYTFDPNSDVLWINFCNAIRPTLEAMKADQGIEDYKIVKVATNQKAMLKARVRIIPIEAVEDFDIELSLEDSLGETDVSISE